LHKTVAPGHRVPPLRKRRKDGAPSALVIPTKINTFDADDTDKKTNDERPMTND
jgi:hypothetical protein